MAEKTENALVKNWQTPQIMWQKTNNKILCLPSIACNELVHSDGVLMFNECFTLSQDGAEDHGTGFTQTLEFNLPHKEYRWVIIMK